jgi:hypothetical protein
MRLLPIVTASLATAWFALAGLAAPAMAQTNYPWCSNFADGFGGTNCGFVSYEQCMNTVRGSGGFCNQNDMYHPQSAGAAAAHKPHKTSSRSKPSSRKSS